MSKQQDNPTMSLASYPLCRGEGVEFGRKALSEIFNPISLEPAKGDRSFQCSIHGVKLQNILVSSLSYRGNSVAAPLDQLDYYTLQLIPSGRLLFEIDGKNEIICSRKQGRMLSSGQRVRVHLADKSQCLALLIKSSHLDDVLSTWTGHSKIPPIQFKKQLMMKKPSVISFLSYFNTVVADLDRTGAILKMPAALASLEHMLVTFMLCGLDHNLGDFFSENSAKAGISQVRKIEEYLEGNISKPINMKILSQVTEHSTRSIYRAFRKHRDYSPMEFLRNIRMNLARKKLMHAKHGDTVTNIVYESGFSHLGRFSTAYKCCFGERPSETLLRSLRDKNTSLTPSTPV
jgi:AraC-like DNA-binding protein